jgi:hypothetical protein
MTQERKQFKLSPPLWLPDRTNEAMQSVKPLPPVSVGLLWKKKIVVDLKAQCILYQKCGVLN